MNSIGNGEAKEHLCTTHGRELREVGGECYRGYGAERIGIKGRKERGQL